ncbi:MAG: hypothetical protein MPEBLZ_01811 [Candidatus Methanoperedens nitroreducens]|uniref:Uncharacterized protein n=1 Tax=Candidatus Methanoperedens nitratireducens TaxID=1392998 RepID=A0A0P7ZIN5_9EURY|nr:MAG: hypothetical protein MPEBLZ_01811 [Candidatus Methanoperedens sp. BLZ1]
MELKRQYENKDPNGYIDDCYVIGEYLRIDLLKSIDII